MIKFSDIITRERIIISDGHCSKYEILGYMSEKFADCAEIDGKHKIFPDIIERESIFSTGIGAGVAIPHIHKPYISGVNAAFCVMRSPIDYNSMDEIPVSFIIMILTSGKEHEKYLGTVAKFANLLRSENMRNTLISATAENDIMKLLDDSEEFKEE